MKKATRNFCVFVLVSLFPFSGAGAQAQQNCRSQRAPYPQLASEEDYSFLKEKDCRTDAWDPVKFVPLDASGETYFSFGGQIRERYEYFHNANWGQGPQTANG